MLELKTFTLDDIRNNNPALCCDPNRYAPEGWSGTILDVLEHENIPPEDRIWVACYIEDALPDSVLRLFAARVARKALAGLSRIGPRSWNATVVAEMYAYGLATDAELKAARGAAWYATRDAARGGAWYATRDAARRAACYATRRVARYAAWEAACEAARDAAWYVARHAARKWQVKELVRIIKEWEG